MAKDDLDDRQPLNSGVPEEEQEVPAEDPEEYFKAGKFLLMRDKQKEALRAFRRAFEMNSADPRYMSYYGVCLASVSGRLKEGLALCEKAAAKEFFRAEMFLNLAKVYMKIGNRGKAHDALRKGMSLDRENKDIKRELDKMGVRRPPVLPFLDRNSGINKFAGKVLYKLRLR
jgi:tetratricopeptide (TPR) repeat protein